MDISFNNYRPVDRLELNNIKEKEQQESAHLSKHINRSVHARKEVQFPQSVNMKGANLLTSRECVQNLTLINHHIDSLITQQSNTLYSLFSSQSVRRKIKQNKRDNADQEEYIAEDPEQIDKRLVNLLISIFKYIQKNRLFDEYKLYAFYKKSDENALNSRQMIVVIPFVDGIPCQGSVYFLVLDSDGGIRKITLPIQVSQVGYHYNSDWLTIESKELMGSSLVSICLQTHDGLLVDGYCLSSQPISEQSNEPNYLYIQGFSKAWNSLSDISNV
jgi:hypothetical protein